MKDIRLACVFLVSVTVLCHLATCTPLALSGSLSLPALDVPILSSLVPIDKVPSSSTSSPIGKAAGSASSLPIYDAPFTDSKEEMDATIACPAGLTGARNGVVLSVPGTAMDAPGCYDAGPFRRLLPDKGFDICYVSPPHRQMGDVQVSGEYVANAIMTLASQSATGSVKVLGHSQGAGLSIPWAMIFFPSARAKVASFVALAPDFHGTVLYPYPICDVQKLASLGQGCAPCTLQQQRGSMALTALQFFLRQAPVPTTVIITLTDEVVLPSVPLSPFSHVPGSVEASVQQLCGPLTMAGHVTLLAHPASYALTLNAFLSSSGRADLTKFMSIRDCIMPQLSSFDFASAWTTFDGISQAIAAAISSSDVRVLREPALKQYVCDAGFPGPCGIEGQAPTVLDRLGQA